MAAAFKSKNIKLGLMFIGFMELAFEKGKIVFDRELSNLDLLVLRFVKILDRLGIDYVIISGYIAILFGRSRNTEDVDLFVEEMPFGKFERFWKELELEGFECLNTPDMEEAYNHYLKEKIAVRFAEKGFIQPNFEVKFPKTRYNEYSLKNKIEVILKGEKLKTSEMELQIAFKLSLGSDKDFEDARHLYKVFKEHLDKSLLEKQIHALKVEKQAEMVLWKKD
jgi:predicted nucleotidyltransferase